MQRTRPRPSWMAGAAVVLGLCTAAVATSQSPGPRVPVAGGGGGLWISDSALEGGRRLLLIVDPATRHAAVYHVDATSGGLTLKSTRDIAWDLALDEFNAQDPRPAAIRQMLQSPPVGPAPGSR